MANFLYSATDAHGNTLDGFVEAASAANARDELLARGLMDVCLQNEASFDFDVPAAALASGLDEQQLAAMTVRFMKRPGLASAMREVARCNMQFIGISALLAVAAFAFEWRWWGALALTLALLPFAVALWKYRSARDYTQLVEAFVTGDWQRMSDLVERVRAGDLKTEKVVFDLDFRCAYATIRQGASLATALAAIEAARWKERLSSHPGLYEAQVALLHAAADDRAGFIDAMHRAASASGAEPARVLDLALAQARVGDAEEAARLLQGIDTSLLPPYAAGFIAWTRGLLALRRQDTEAPALLGQAVAAFLALSAINPGAWTALAYCAADCARALRAAGDADRARATLQPVWPILHAHASAELLNDLADLAPAQGGPQAPNA